jgi:hypothetical protein
MDLRLTLVGLCLGLALSVLPACSSTEITESPKTGFASEVGEPKTPEIVWTSRSSAK